MTPESVSNKANVLSALKPLESGVPVAAVRYHGTIHEFVMLNVITDDPSPRAAIEQASIKLKNVLSG